MGRTHSFTRRGNDDNTLALGQQSLSYGIDKVFIGGEHVPKTLDQIVEQLGVMGVSRQERKMGNHPAASNPQAQLEPIIAQLFGRTATIIGLLLKQQSRPLPARNRRPFIQRPLI